MIIREDIPLGITYHENGRISSYKDSNGFWYEKTYDENGNPLTLKDSNGFWYEKTYDENGLLSYKNSNGDDRVRVLIGEYYNLFYDAKRGTYSAGCKTNLSYIQCRTLYENSDEVDKDSFMEFIENIEKYRN